MPTTEELIASAKQLGEQIAEHDAAKDLKAATEKLRNDQAAQQSVQTFNQFLQQLAYKEQSGMPIEPAEKQKLSALQQEVSANLTLLSFQQAQVAYVDLMRQVDDALTSAGPDPTEVPGAEEKEESPAGGNRIIF